MQYRPEIVTAVDVKARVITVVLMPVMMLGGVAVQLLLKDVRDLADQRAAGVTVPDDGDEAFRHRLRVAAACDDSAPADEVAVRAHARLAAAPSVLATAALDDLVGAEHRPNVPGTIDEHPNWRIPLPVPLDDLPGHPLAERIAAVLREARPPGGDARGR